MQDLINSQTKTRPKLQADLMTDFDHEWDQGQLMITVQAGLRIGIDDHQNYKMATMTSGIENSLQ